jgi:hypothetical protein
MPYIGNQLATQFQAFATQTITGDGSTGYTLDRAVANGKELLVYINNVKQEEGSGKSYTASGTTITFSAAVASTDSCYVVFLGSAIQTVTAPAGSIVGSQLSSSFSVFDDEDSNIVIGRGRIGNTISASDHASFQHRDLSTGSNLNYAILQTASGGTQINSSSGQSLFINIGNSQAIKVDSNKIITMENQPAVQAKVSSNQLNITAGSLYTIPFATETFDQNADYDNSTYTFTAPVTGRYFIGVQATIGGMPSGADYFQYAIQTSNRTYNVTVDPDNISGSGIVYYGFPFTVLADMDASDTAIVKFLVQGSTNTTDFYAETYLSIFLAC